MDINKMTRKQFEELPYLEAYNESKHSVEEIEVDSIVLLPSKKHDNSGYNLFEVVACKDDKPIGKVFGYDTFSIFMNDKCSRVGIDCLRGSSLMRIFLPRNDYMLKAIFHEIKHKGEL